MNLTQKETALLNELKSAEQLCIDKYQKYSNEASDTELKNLFNQIGQVEQGHLDTLNQMLNGSVPVIGNSNSNSQTTTVTDNLANAATAKEQENDKYLCTDALSMEKHVSSMYDTSVFEFVSPNTRNILNHIQKEEQEHGEKIYNYMSQNGMY